MDRFILMLDMRMDCPYRRPMNPKCTDLVVKSNVLVNAMFDMSLQEQRFLAFLIAQIDRSLEPRPKQPVDQEINVLDFAEAFGVAPCNAYPLVKSIAKNFMRRVIFFDDGLDEVGVPVIAKYRYRKSEGRIWLRFDEDLIPHMLGLKSHFTQYRIQDVYQFNSKTTWRVYELLRQYKDVGKRDFDLDEFRRKVGVAGLYSVVADLRKRVILPAVQEINTTSDIQVEWEQVKRGRRIVSLRFHIASNEATKTPREKIREKAEKELGKSPCLAPELAKLLREEYRVNAKQAKALADLAAGDREAEARSMLPKLRKRWEKLPEAKRVALGGYVFKALKAHLTQGTLI